MEKRAYILVIDDNRQDISDLKNLMRGLPYDLSFAESGVEGIVKASIHHPDVILLETDLPHLDGFETCRLIRSHYALGETPVVLMNRRGDAESRLTGLRVGADDFIVKPPDHLELQGRLQGVIRLNRYRLLLEQRRESDLDVENKRVVHDQNVEGWMRLLEVRDMETEGHVQRVSEMTLALAQMAGLAEEELKHVWRGAMLHDLGMLGIPDSILKKSGGLEEDEIRIIQAHPVYAYNWFNGVKFLRPALDIPYCHHEKWDGGGYPRGLKGEQIPLAARLFAVADTWDALISDRPYRHAVSIPEARRTIEALSGIQFDPYAVELFIRLLDQA